MQWHHAKYYTRTTTNLNGTSGWATILHTTNPALKPRTRCRIHLCAFNPCEANHPASTYGNVGLPRTRSSVSRIPEATLAAVAAIGERNARMQMRSVTPELFQPEWSVAPNHKVSQSPSPSVVNDPMDQCDDFDAPEEPECPQPKSRRKWRRQRRKETMEKTASRRRRRIR